MEPHKSLCTILDAVGARSDALMVDYFSAPVRASSAAFCLLWFVHVAHLRICNNVLSLRPFSLGTGLRNPWDMHRFSGSSRLRHQL